MLFRDGQVCELCLDMKVPWPSVLHGCYRGNRLATGIAATTLSMHRFLKTWNRDVARYIALNEFSRSKFIEGGLPVEKIVIKPNFVSPDPTSGRNDGEFVLYVGRLSEEKGTNLMLSAWHHLNRSVPLVIVGSGPLEVEVVSAATRNPNITYHGWLPREKVLNIMQSAAILVFPSQCYENFPMSIVEAFAVGLPVIATNLGAMQRIVEHNRTGLHFAPHDPQDLAAKINWAFEHPEALRRMRREARKESKYTARENLRQLLSIYDSAIAGCSRGRLAHPK